MANLTFTDPRTSSTYTWTRNPNSEQAAAKTRAIERTSNTGNVGATKQQGDDGSLIFDYQVYVNSSAQELALWQWYVLCRSQTIRVTDWLGEVYEGQITSLTRQRQLGPMNGQPWAIFDLQFEVYSFVSGPLATAGVNP